MAAAAFWRAWSIWAVSVAVTVTTIAYSATHPLSVKLASFQVSRLDRVTAIMFIGAFATVGALLAWKRPENPIGWLLSAIGLVFAVAVFSVFLAHFPQTLALAGGRASGTCPALGCARSWYCCLTPASALPPLAAGGLGRWSRRGLLGPGLRVRSHAHHG